MNDNSVCSLVSGDLQAVFWPGSGMLGVSLRHRGVELLRRIDDLESARTKGCTAGFLEGFPYAQVFAPKDLEFIALEPMTAPTSAPTSGNNLRVIEPGAEFRASFRIFVHTDA